MTYNTGEPVEDVEQNAAHHGQDDVIAGQADDTSDEETYPVPPQGSSGTSLTEIFIQVTGDQKAIEKDDVDSGTLDNIEKDD